MSCTTLYMWKTYFNSSLFMQKTRVDTILERARAQAKGTSDVIENAAKWNIKVWKFEKVVAYVRDVKAKIGLKSNSGGQQRLLRTNSVDSGLNVASEIRAPYIKFEETNFQFRPVFFEFKKFPVLHPENPRPGVSPFYAPDPAYAAQTEQQQLLAAAAAQNRGGRKSYRDERKRSKPAAATVTKPAAAAAAVAEASPQQPPIKRQTTGGAPAAAAAAAAKSVSGYCEICEQRYESLDAHLNESTHRHTIAVSSLWQKVDLCINLVNCNSEDSHPALSTE